MPSSMTHYYFCKDVYDKLDRNIKKNINLNKCRVFAQGPDIYYFYNLFIGKKHEEYYSLGYKIHTSNTKLYFSKMINYIADNNLINNKDIISFLYGSICHYVLDKTIHPYIIYYSGIYNKNNTETYKYNSIHEEIEYYFDIYMIYQNIKSDPSKFKVYDFLFTDIKFNNNLMKMIDNINKEVYDYSNTSKAYSRSIRCMKYFFRIFNYDPYGIKKFIYKGIDKFTPLSIHRTYELSYHYYYKEKKYFLNIDKDQWNHPCDKNEIYNYSFLMLYRMAMDEVLNTFNEIYDMINNRNIDDEKLKILFTDVSYLTNKGYDKVPIFFRF